MAKKISKRKKRPVKEAAERVIKSWNQAAEEIGSLKVTILERKYSLDIYDTLVVNNPQNIEEVLIKLSEASSILWTLGAMKTDAEKEYEMENLSYNIWLENCKDDIDEKSEAGKERGVIVEYEDHYKEKRSMLINLKANLGRVSRAKNAVDRMCFMMQSVGAILREEKNNQNMSR